MKKITERKDPTALRELTWLTPRWSTRRNPDSWGDLRGPPSTTPIPRTPSKTGEKNSAGMIAAGRDHFWDEWHSMQICLIGEPHKKSLKMGLAKSAQLGQVFDREWTWVRILEVTKMTHCHKDGAVVKEQVPPDAEQKQRCRKRSKIF